MQHVDTMTEARQAPVRPNINVRSHQEMIEIMQQQLEERRVDVGLELSEDGDPVMAGGQPLSHFLFDVKDGSFVERAVVGHVKRSIFQDMVGATLHQRAHEVSSHRDGRWELVAWKIVSITKLRRDRAKTDEQAELHAEWEPKPNGQPRPGLTEHLYAKDAAHRMIMVFAELDQEPPVDVTHRLENGQRQGALYQWAHRNGYDKEEGREAGTPYTFRGVTKRYRQDREDSLEVLSAFAGALASGVEVTEPVETEPAGPTESQVEFAITAIDSGMELGAVAKAIGVHHNTLRAAIKRHQEAGE